MQLKNFLKLHPITYLLLAAAIIVVIALLAAPASSASANQCSSCHGTKYNQQLDIVEGNSQNRIPTSLQVGQTQTVTVAIQNINNALRYNGLSSVSLTLSSQNSHFSVATPTYNVGTLSTGSTTATWQITGTSAGSDALVISASATNTHNNLRFSDSYSPTPSITVSAVATVTPTPAPTATPTAAPTPIPTVTTRPSPTSTLPPSATPTASPTPGTTIPSQTPAPTTPSPTTNPTQDSTSTPQPNQTVNPTDTPNPSQENTTTTPNPTNTSATTAPDQNTQNVNPVTITQNSMGKLTIVAPEGSKIAWENLNQGVTLSPNGATQPLTVNIKYSSTDGTNTLSSNTLELSWDAVGGTAPLKATVEYESSYSPGTWTVIAENILGEGAYTWTIPQTENNNIRMHIKVSDSSAQGQTASTTANINVTRNPQLSTASWSVSIYPSYIQTVQIIAAALAGAFYVKKIKTKRLSVQSTKQRTA